MEFYGYGGCRNRNYHDKLSENNAEDVQGLRGVYERGSIGSQSVHIRFRIVSIGLKSVQNRANRVIIESEKLNRLTRFAMLRPMLDSGLMQNEVCTSDINKLDMEAGLLTVVGKGEKERTVHVGQLSIQFIKAYITACPFRISNNLFVYKLGKPMSNNALKLMVAKLSNKLPFEFSCHKLRHNFATNYCLDMYEEKGHMDAYSLQILLGHSEIETTMRYIHHATQITASRAAISHLDKHLQPHKS